MQTECNSQRILFQELGRREVVADFQGGNITSDAGGLLLGDINRSRRVIERFARCFTDFRIPKRTDHTLKELLAQRIYGIGILPAKCKRTSLRFSENDLPMMILSRVNFFKISNMFG